jgi:hypothetical protein
MPSPHPDPEDDSDDRGEDPQSQGDERIPPPLPIRKSVKPGPTQERNKEASEQV